MKKLIFVMNDRAEVGKTCFSSALVRAIRTQEVATGFLSVTGEKPAGSSNSPAYDGMWNIIEENDVQVLFDWCERYDALVCDVESGYADAVMELYESEDLDLVLGEHDIEMTVITPQVDEAACNEEIALIANRISDNAYYVVPRIPVDEFASFLQTWEDSEAAATLEYLGAVLVDVPRVTDPIQETLADHGLSIIDAMDRDPNSLPAHAADALEGWFQDFDLQLEEALDYLLPDLRGRHGFKRAANA